MLSYRGSKAEADATVADVRARGRQAFAVAADVSRGTDCAALVGAAVGEFGRVDALVNMASVYGSTPLDELTEAAFDRDIAVNLKSTFLCAQAAVSVMRRTGGGRIVNVADWLARSGRPGITASRRTTWPRRASSRSPRRWRSNSRATRSW